MNLVKLRMAIPIAILLLFCALSPVGKADTPPSPPSKSPASAKADRPNVVLLVLDALRADRIDAKRNGQSLMPWLSEFAKTGVRFTHAYSPCSWTRPSMASLFTSLNVETHQVYFAVDPQSPESSKSDALPSTLPVLADWMKQAGYSTLAVQTNGNLVPDFGFARGYDEYIYEHDATATRVTDLALGRLEKPEAATPFFLYLHYIDPHAPYIAPAKYTEMLGGLPPLEASERAVVDDFIPYVLDYSEHLLNGAPRKIAELSETAKEAIRIRYDAETRYLDDELKRLVEAIQSNHPDTMFVITADHGESFWEHRFIGHGLTMYEEEIRVPLIINGFNLKPAVIERAVGTVGLLPTLANLLSLTPLPIWQGWDWFADGAQPIYSFTLGPWKRCGREVEAVVDGAEKFIRNRASKEQELFLLDKDPQERASALGAQPEIAKRLLSALDAHQKTNIEAQTRSESGKVGLDEERLEELRSQGYITDSGKPKDKPNQVPLDQDRIEELRSQGYIR